MASNNISTLEGVVDDANRGTTYFFSRSRTSASLCQRVQLFLSIYWKSCLVVATPLLLLPIPILYEGEAFRCMYVVLIMATYWVLELLPLPVTSMLPIVLFPTMGILDSDKTCASYMKETNMMFMGGLMIAAGVQHSKLPKRVALWTVQVVGCSHRRLNFGLTFVTMFISMWVSNAAATTMMVPIVEAILHVLQEQGLGDVYKDRPKAVENGKEGKETKGKGDNESVPMPSDITICYFLSIAYASTLGGCGTLVGTATNSAFKGIFDSEFKDNKELKDSVNFFWFMAYSAPPMLLTQLLVWVALQITFMGLFRPNSEAAKRVELASSGSETTLKVIKEQYRNLGPATFHEKASGSLFIVAVFLYIFRKPGFMTGWSQLLTNMQVKDGVTSIFIVILMFVLPMAVDFFKFFSSAASYEELAATKPSPGIVTWNILKEKVPWGLLFLLGGGFALAEGSKSSGLSALIGSSLQGLRGLPAPLVLLVVLLVTQLITEFTSNVAIANLILPVLANMARQLNMDPRYLMIPATLACSMAFHMPVGTPPNAIVAGVAHIPTSKMAIGGIGPKIITTLIIWASYPLYGTYIFSEGDFLGLSGAGKVMTETLSLQCNGTTPTSLLQKGVTLFNCSLPYKINSTAVSPGNATLVGDVIGGLFRCDYLPYFRANNSI
ncbi:protein I'm not dead yet isoform X1 [Plutella xylostella]|uniref:protein I'm not dead yet isoform X1 n=1 Tax=Plutella xylostella TaxID=51655 RepID=UPI002032C150|nr:protein I'm not dead yet isoform X1 [Plutella xylostella]